MILPVHDRIRAQLTDVIASRFGIDRADVPSIVIETPPRRALGDLAVPVAFELARRLRKAPRAIARDLAGALGPLAGISRVEAAPNGYLNFFFDRPAFLIERLEGAAFGASDVRASEKVIVEHTAINPNKAAHIGHLRNAALGDTLVRALRFRGWPVEVQNYIDDTGVQVADVVVGFRELEGQTLDGVKKIEAGTRFDFYCWDLYARVTEWYGTDKDRLKLRGETLHAIEAGGNEVADLAAFIADRIVRCHLATMARLNIGYDLLGWEGDILRLHFWATAFEQLKQRGSVYMQTEGKLAGCWVMAIEDIDDRETGDRGIDEPPDDAAEQAREKVIVRSDGTVTYVGKDIAYQFWKFGLLDRDFFYRVFAERADGTPLWATASTPSSDARTPPSFGRATAVYNVIDTRQAYLQKLVKQALAAMGFAKQAERSTHFSYEMVALSHATARELGYDPADSEGRPFVEVSGRKGLGVKADDLLDRLAEKAHLEVARRNEALPPDECRRTGIDIATAAVRYFMVKYSRVKVIAFDIEEALSFEGESGPYLQYAAVRAGNILQKLEERDGMGARSIGAALAGVRVDAITSGEDADDLWDLVLQASRLDEMVESAIRSLELSTLAKFAFTLAQAFNGFYHRQQILREEREDVRLWRAAGVAYVRQQLTLALDLMGCSVPARM